MTKDNIKHAEVAFASAVDPRGPIGGRFRGQVSALGSPTEGEGAPRLASRAAASPPASGSGRIPLRRVARLTRGPLVGAGMIAVGLVALVGGRSDTKAADVLVATRSLAPGTVLRASDLEPTALHAGADLLATLVSRSSEASVLGSTLLSRLDAGEPLARSLVAAATPAAFTLSVGGEQTLAGALEPGDRVTVLATFATPSGGEVTRTLGQSLLVLAVGQPPSLGDPSEETVPVTVALTDPAIASQLALANSAAHIDLMRDGTALATVPSATAPGAAR